MYLWKGKVYERYEGGVEEGGSSLVRKENYISLLFFRGCSASESCCSYRGDSDISDIIYDEFRTWIAPLELVSVPMHEASTLEGSVAALLGCCCCCWNPRSTGQRRRHLSSSRSLCRSQREGGKNFGRGTDANYDFSSSAFLFCLPPH